LKQPLILIIYYILTTITPFIHLSTLISEPTLLLCTKTPPRCSYHCFVEFIIQTNLLETFYRTKYLTPFSTLSNHTVSYVLNQPLRCFVIYLNLSTSPSLSPIIVTIRLLQILPSLSNLILYIILYFISTFR